MSYFKKRGLARFDQQFLAGGSFGNWITLLHENGGVDIRYLARWLYISFVALISFPFQLYEKYKYDSIISRTEIKAAPVFILGTLAQRDHLCAPVDAAKSGIHCRDIPAYDDSRNISYREDF